MKSVSMLGALSAAALLLGTVSAQAGSTPQQKCSSAKIKCGSGKATGLLGCFGKAEGKGIPVDPLCTGKVVTKFTDPTTGKGCMEKAEAKPPCVTTGDAGSLETKVDNFVDDIVSTIDGGNPTPPLSKCAASQKKCVANKVKAELGCYGKAAGSGIPVDPLCLGKADTKFADPVKGCMAKLELKTPNDCITTGQTGTLEGKVDAFALDVFGELVLGPSPTLLDFTVGIGGSTCGAALNSSNTVLATLHCGGLNIGGGMSTVAEGPTPDGTTTRFTLSCSGGACTVGHFDTAPAANSADPDCSNTGCNFGGPLEIPNATSPGLSSCVGNVYSAPASGTLSRLDGSSSQVTKLTSSTFITGNVGQPCPRCRSGGGTGSILSGSPSSPQTGNCDRTAGHPACTTTNSKGLTRDCPPAGIAVGPIPVDLTPLNTGTSNKSDAAGNFCGQSGTAPGTFGCFGHGGTGATLCVSITENGSPAGPLSNGVSAPVTLATVFCIPATGGIVDSAADLPGPGATALVGTVNAHN